LPALWQPHDFTARFSPLLMIFACLSFAFTHNFCRSLPALHDAARRASPDAQTFCRIMREAKEKAGKSSAMVKSRR